MCFHCLLAFLSLKNVRYFKKSTILIYSIHMYAIEVNEMNELVCVSVFNPVTFSEAYPDINHYKVCLFSNQCSNLFQTSDVGQQLAPDVLSPNFFLHRALDFVTSLLALEWIQSPGQKALLCPLLPHNQIKIISVSYNSHDAIRLQRKHICYH